MKKDETYAVKPLVEALAAPHLVHGRRDVNRRQVATLREIVGDPFDPVALDPAWCTSDVLALARYAYATGAFGVLPVLADALEDAGCADRRVLDHCRGGGRHVPGCWVLDLLLGAEVAGTGSASRSHLAAEARSEAAGTGEADYW